MKIPYIVLKCQFIAEFINKILLCQNIFQLQQGSYLFVGIIVKEWNVVPRFYNVNAQVTQYYSKKMEDIVLKYQFIACFVPTLKFYSFFSTECIFEARMLYQCCPSIFLLMSRVFCFVCVF